MNKIFLTMALFLVLLPSSMAASNILLELVDEQLVATSVSDDDGSIEQVDVFVTGSTTIRETFYGVTQGQILQVTFGETDTVSYNFNDTDGSEIGLGTMLIVQTGDEPPACTTGCESNPNIRIIRSLTINPRLAPGNSAYYADIVVELDESQPYSSLQLKYDFNDGDIKTAQLIFDGSKHTATIGPLTQKVKLKALLQLVDSNAKTHSSSKSMWLELFLPSSNSCNVGTVITTAPNIESIGEEKVLFASLEGFSYLSIADDGSGNLSASVVVDDDSSIERVDIFYRIGSDVTQTTYFDVTENMSLGSVPSNDFSWFNYFDSDGTMSNISVLNQFIDDDTVIILPPPEERPDYFTEVNILSSVSSDERTFTLSVEASKGEDTPDLVEYVYRIDGGSPRPPIALTDNGDSYTGTIGLFDSELLIEGYAKGLGDKGDQLKTNIPSWFALVLGEQLECVELCNDGVDNDFDGRVDEDCVVLSELFFLKKNVPFFSLIDQPVVGDVTIKNSGVARSSSFSVEFYFNNELVLTQPIGSLGRGETEQISFEIPYKEEYEGENKMKIIIDPENDVAELLENNNTYEQEVIIGANFFDIIMNYNETPFPGDFRQIKIRDANERPVQSANVTIITPSGTEMPLQSDREGLVEFQLPESNTYSVSVAKESFIPFKGRFAIAPIRLIGLKEIVPVGDLQEFIVENEEKLKLTNGTVEISQPQGTTLSFELSSEQTVSFSASQQGKYALRVVRNELVVFESDFLATGIIESLLIGPGSIFDLLFGPIIRTPILFLLLILLSAAAAYFAYSKAPMFFRKGAKGTTEKKIERAIRIGIGAVFFVMPFQFDRFFGFNGALMAIFLEVILIIIYDYYLKSIKTSRKAIKV